MAGGGGGWHKAWVSGCLPLAAPIGLSPLLILTLCGSERVLVVSTEPLDDLSCLNTPGRLSRRPGGGGGGCVCCHCWDATLFAGPILFNAVLSSGICEPDREP